MHYNYIFQYIFARYSRKFCVSYAEQIILKKITKTNLELYIGVSKGAGLFVIFAVIVILVIRKQRNGGSDDTFLNPTHYSLVQPDARLSP